MPTIGPLHHHKPGTEAGRLACSEQRSICLSVSTTHASFAGEVQWNVSAQGRKDPTGFAAAHASIHNHFNHDRHLNPRDVFKQNRSAALAEWRQLAA